MYVCVLKYINICMYVCMYVYACQEHLDNMMLEPELPIAPESPLEHSELRFCILVCLCV